MINVQVNVLCELSVRPIDDALWPTLRLHEISSLSLLFFSFPFSALPPSALPFFFLSCLYLSFFLLSDTVERTLSVAVLETSWGQKKGKSRPTCWGEKRKAGKKWNKMKEKFMNLKNGKETWRTPVFRDDLILSQCKTEFKISTELPFLIALFVFPIHLLQNIGLHIFVIIFDFAMYVVYDILDVWYNCCTSMLLCYGYFEWCLNGVVDDMYTWSMSVSKCCIVVNVIVYDKSTNILEVIRNERPFCWFEPFWTTSSIKRSISSEEHFNNVDRWLTPKLCFHLVRQDKKLSLIVLCLALTGARRSRCPLRCLGLTATRGQIAHFRMCNKN